MRQFDLERDIAEYRRKEKYRLIEIISRTAIEPTSDVSIAAMRIAAEQRVDLGVAIEAAKLVAWQENEE